MVWNNYDIILKPLFLTRSNSSSDENWPISHRVFAPQFTHSFYCPPWNISKNLRHCLITSPPLLWSTTILYSWGSLSLFSPKLPGLFRLSIPLHLCLSFLVNALFSLVPLLGHTLADSSLLLGLKNHISPSLCHLNPLLMAHFSQTLVIFIFPHHSLLFLKCVIFSIPCLLHIFLMPFVTDTVLLSYPGALVRRWCSALIARGNNFS